MLKLEIDFEVSILNLIEYDFPIYFELLVNLKVETLKCSLLSRNLEESIENFNRLNNVKKIELRFYNVMDINNPLFLLK